MTANMEVAIGIDLGTTNTCAAVFRNGHWEAIRSEHGQTTTPSYVGFDGEGRQLGLPAKNNAFLNPTNTIFSIKRLMGKRFDDPEVAENSAKWPFQVVNLEGDAAVSIEENDLTKVLKPEEISSMVLRQVKQSAEVHLETQLTKAVITVPANFTDRQRKATKRAGEMAGLNVIGIINEPTAAAIAYGLQTIGEKTILVFDFGGGTLDVSILKITDGQTFEVLATSGIMHLGGDDFDERIILKLKTNFEAQHGVNLENVLDAKTYREAMSRLRTKAEEAKITLSSGTTSTTRIKVNNFYGNVHLKTRLSREEFEQLCDDLFQQILVPVRQALNDANLLKDNIDQVVMVGGSSKMPRIVGILRSFFTEQTIHRDISPAEAIAFGASVYAHAVQAALEMESHAGIRLLEIIPRSLGVEIYGGWMSSVVPKHTRIPCIKSKVFTTVYDNTPSVSINVFEGEARRVEDNYSLDQFILTGIFIAPAGVPKIEVTFEYDLEGILKVSARDKDTEESAEITIRHNRNEERGKAAVVLEASENERIEAKRELRAYLEGLHHLADEETRLKLQGPAARNIQSVAFSADLLQISDYVTALEQIRQLFN